MLRYLWAGYQRALAEPTMKTIFLLMAAYDGRVIIPVDLVCRDYFSPLTPKKYIEKIRAGEIKLPLVRMEKSQKGAKGVALNDLATYLDAQIAVAQRDMEAMHGT
jgi:hypothetical protein